MTGKVVINMSKAKNIDHTGIRVDLIGQIGTLLRVATSAAENIYEKSQSMNFVSLSRELEPPGTYLPTTIALCNTCAPPPRRRAHRKRQLRVRLQQGGEAVRELPGHRRSAQVHTVPLSP